MLTGKQAKEVHAKLLSDAKGSPYNKPYVSGYYKSDNVNSGFDVESDNVWVAFDNTTADCWTEEFASDKDAEKWCSEVNPQSPIIVKDLLEKQEYGTIFEIWQEHIEGYSEPPPEYLLLNELSDLIDVDENVCKAISDTLNKEDVMEIPSGNKLQLVCCNSPIKLEEQPANYGHQFIGLCDVCGNTYGIEDLTEIAEELSDEDETVYHCHKCEKAIGLSDYEVGQGLCPDCIKNIN